MVPPETEDMRRAIGLPAETEKAPSRRGRGGEGRDEMPLYEYELPECSVLEIHMQGRYGEDLWGSHVHLCPECFEDVPCDDTCTWDGESVTNEGVPTCHPVICERCETTGRLYHDQGGGI